MKEILLIRRDRRRRRPKPGAADTELGPNRPAA